MPKQKVVLIGLGLVLLMGISIGSILLMQTQSVFARPLGFNGATAAAYADSWATSRNGNYPSFSNDCTNFTSQALHDSSGGGYPFRYSPHPEWWVERVLFWWNYTHSWSVVPDNWNFLMADYPGGWDWGYQDTSKNTNGALKGDILFYDWDGNGTLDHTSIEVAYSGCDPANPSWCGDLVDQHTNDRFHAIWHLRPYNSQAATTQVRLAHIDPGN